MFFESAKQCICTSFVELPELLVELGSYLDTMKHTSGLPQITNHNIAICSTCSLSSRLDITRVRLENAQTRVCYTQPYHINRHTKVRGRPSHASMQDTIEDNVCTPADTPVPHVSHTDTHICEIQIPSLVFSCETEIGKAA